MDDQALTPEMRRKVMAELGRKGGLARGAAKSRGDHQYYQRLSKIAGAAPHVWRYELRRWNGSEWAVPEEGRTSFRSSGAAERECIRRLQEDLSATYHVFDRDQDVVVSELDRIAAEQWLREDGDRLEEAPTALPSPNEVTEEVEMGPRPNATTTTERATRGIRLNPSQEVAIEAVRARLAARTGGSFSFSAAVRYLVTLGLERDALTGGETDVQVSTLRSPLRLAVVEWIPNGSGKPEVRPTGHSLPADRGVAKEAVEKGYLAWTVSDEGMLAKYKAGSIVCVDPSASPTADETGVWWTGTKAVLREARQIEGLGLALVPSTLGFPLVKADGDVRFLGRLVRVVQMN